MMIDDSVEPRKRLIRGESVDLSPTRGDRVDASQGLAWGPERTIEAAMLVDLATAPLGSDRWAHRPIRLAGARVVGRLDFEAAIMTRPLYLTDCFIEEPIMLETAQVLTIRLTGCHIIGLSAKALRTQGDLKLDKGFASSG